MDGGGQVEITWCSSLLAQHIPAQPWQQQYVSKQVTDLSQLGAL